MTVAGFSAGLAFFLASLSLAPLLDLVAFEVIDKDSQRLNKSNTTTRYGQYQQNLFKF